MSMLFETNDRPDSGIQKKLTDNSTPFSMIPFPKQVEQPFTNFQEVLASERYKEIVENFHKYTSPDFILNPVDVMPLMMTMLKDLNNISIIERPFRETLEKMAIDLVLKEMGIPNNAFHFDVKIVDMDQINMDDFKHGLNEKNDEEIDIDDEILLPEKINLERAKRRLINSIIQGSSERGHYMYHIVEDELTDLFGNENIIKYYGRMMSINDVMYWEFSDDAITQIGNSSSVAGKETINRNTIPPTIYVRSINFPTLIHEIIKGVMEIFAVHGLPENYTEFSSEEDTLDNEMWDLRLGPTIWKRIRSQFPNEIIIDENKIELQNYLLVEMFKLPADEFLYLIRELMKSSDNGKQIINQLLKKIETEQKDDIDDDDID